MRSDDQNSQRDDRFLVSLALLALMPIVAQQSDATPSRSTGFRRMGDRANRNHYIVVLDRDAVGRPGIPNSQFRNAL